MFISDKSISYKLVLALFLALFLLSDTAQAQRTTEKSSLTSPNYISKKDPKRVKSAVDKALLEAVKNLNYEEAKKALDKQADVDVQDEEGNSALILAAKADSIEFVSLLIQSGADILLRNKKNQTALMAAQSQQTMIVIDSRKGLQPVFELLLFAARDLPEKDKIQYAKEAIFFSKGDFRTIDYVLNLGIDPNLRVDEEGNTLLTKFSYNGPQQIRQLLALGVDPNLRNNAGETPLMRLSSRFGASLFGASTEVVELLLIGGAQIDATDKIGRSVLFTAVENKNANLVKLLVERGANVNLRDARNQTAFLLAMEKENPEIIKLLIQGGADVNTTNEDGQTPLMTAAKVGKNEIVEALIEAKASLNTQDLLGQTALILAIDKYAYPETVKILLKAGADSSIKDTNGDTALSIAKRDGREDIVKMLEEKNN
jgi:ankyrin repeat protein